MTATPARELVPEVGQQGIARLGVKDVERTVTVLSTVKTFAVECRRVGGLSRHRCFQRLVSVLVEGEDAPRDIAIERFERILPRRRRRK